MESISNGSDADYTPNDQPTKKLRKIHKQCFYCEKFFAINSSQLDVRFRGHYRCDHCTAANVEKKVKYKEVICNFCGVKFTDTYYTKKGLEKTTTRSKKCHDCRNRKIPKGPPPRPKSEYLECDLCGLRFETKIGIYYHMDKHRSDVRCKVCGACFTARSALRSHLRTHFEKYICDQCGFTTNVKSLFRQHNNDHAGKVTSYAKIYPKKPVEKGTFTCEDCGIVFDTKVALGSHQKRQHSEEGLNGFPCKICGEFFPLF